MNKTKQTFVVLAGMLLLPLAQAHALTIDFGPIDGATNNNSRSWMNSVSGTFTDYAQFSLTRTSDISSAVTNAYASSILFINDFKLSLYSGSVIGAGTLLGSASETGGASPPGFQIVALTKLAQDAGSYYLAISGRTADSPSYGGSLSVTVSPVPLPGSAPLFGGAVLALGLAGCGLRHRRRAAQA